MSGRNAFRDMRSLKKQYVNEIAASLTDRDIFLSEETQSYANTLARSMIGSDAKLKVCIDYDSSPDSDVGYTTKDFIYVNGGCSNISSFTSLTDRIMAATGALFHEIAHCIFLDFDAHHDALETIGVGALYGEYPVPQNKEERQYLAEIRKALENEAFRDVFKNMYASLFNCVADEHDEQALIRRYGSYEAACINRMKDTLRYGLVPFEKRWDLLQQGKASPFHLAIGMVLELARFGEIYTLDKKAAEANPLYQALMALRPAFARSAESTKNDDLVFAVNQSIMILWPYLRTALMNMAGTSGSGSSGQASGSAGETQQQKSSSGSGGGSAGSAASGSSSNESQSSGQSSASQSSAGNSGSNSGNAQNGGSEGAQGTPGPGNTQDGEVASGANGPGYRASGDDSEAPSAKELEDALSKLTKEEISQLAQQIADEAKKFGPQVNEKPCDAKQETSGKKNSKRKAKEPPSKAESETDESSAAQNDEETQLKAQAVAETLIRQIAEHLADSKVEREMQKELIVLARGTGFNSTHQGYPLNVTRETGENRELYKSVAKKQTSLLNSLIRQMKMVFKEMANNNVKPHQVTGSHFRASDAHRLDGLCFTSKKMASNEPDIAICILVDLSGSMSSGSRMPAARESALLLYDFCAKLNIPCMVCGHSIPSHGMRFEIMSDFRYCEKDRYRIAEGLAKARNACNRDGMALQIAASMLEKRPEPVKLLMIISDGQPADTNYSGRAAEEDIKEIVRKNARKGVKTIAFAIGDDKERISEIYGERFVDISDLTAMPKKLARIVRRYILESVG